MLIPQALHKGAVPTLVTAVGGQGIIGLMDNPIALISSELTENCTNCTG